MRPRGKWACCNEMKPSIKGSRPGTFAKGGQAGPSCLRDQSCTMQVSSVIGSIRTPYAQVQCFTLTGSSLGEGTVRISRSVLGVSRIIVD